METIVYLFPFFTAVILLLFFRKETVWWEYLLLILPSLLLIFCVEFIMKKTNVSDTEYLGYYVEKISHYDRWNEYIHRTCTRRVPCGTDSKGHTKYRTETYDCSYVENHPERWTYTLNDGSENYFYNEAEFNMVKERLNAKMQFVDMHRHYYTIDGDKQDYVWDARREHIFTMTKEHSYDNPVKSSHSIFKYDDISEKRAKNMGLYDYPEIKNYDQNAIIGWPVDKADQDAVRYVNGVLGKKHQFRMYILIYPDKGVSVVDKQRSYWKGSNKNELILCIGYDTTKRKIKWCECFSWADEPILEVRTKGYFIEKDSLDIQGYCNYIFPIVKNQWVRKSFSDFEYLKIELSDTQVSWLFTIMLIYNIFMSFYIIKNEYKRRDE